MQSKQDKSAATTDLASSRGQDGNNPIDNVSKFYLVFLGVPSLLVVIYASAILFPPSYRASAPVLLWTDGTLTFENGKATVCPRETICSEGVFQIILISFSRLTAFVSYVFMLATFVSKMHHRSHILSNTYFSVNFPFPHFHEVHKFSGFGYALLAIIHTVTHLIRWIIRGDMKLICGRVGLSGTFAIVAMLVVILSMSPWAKLKNWTFEKRFSFHWLFVVIQIALCFHSRRCMIISLVATGLWLIDYLYGYAFRTYRIELVEFTPLPNGSGTQMLWRNPPKFKVNSGEYVKVRLPWLSKGGEEWHPFSVYLREATEEGLDGVLRSKYEVQRTRVILGGAGGRPVVPEKAAVLMIEMQNEFASEGGKLYDSVKGTMESNDMLKKTADLLATARNVGAHVIHAPIVFDKQTDNPNKNLGVLKACHDGKYFERGTWGAEIIDSHSPKLGDRIVSGKVGLDSFIGTDLQNHLEKLGVETVIMGGFLTNCCVDSTMRTAYEKGYNVITLVDGTACDSAMQQTATTTGSYKLFSTPMTCAEASNILTTASKIEDSAPMESLDVEGEEHATMFSTDLTTFINNTLVSSHIDHTKDSLILQEAREELRSQYKTTQVFIAPAGDWTKQVYEDVNAHRQLRSCWVRGPYISPYSIASNFSSLVLIATGIGITPALGVMGQFKGNSRTKALVWSTRCPTMLKFFSPLISNDATLAVIYYTGKEKLSPPEVKEMLSKGNIIIYQERPSSLQDVVSTVITKTTSVLRGGDDTIETMSDMTKEELDHWCAFYCGGSKGICAAFTKYSKEVGINFESELFDW